MLLANGHCGIDPQSNGFTQAMAGSVTLVLIDVKDHNLSDDV